MKLKIATCQFQTTADISRNFDEIIKLIEKASLAGAHVAHFPECALSGYAGSDFTSLDGFDWSKLKQLSEKVANAANKHNIWIILGSTHRLSPPNKPHNSVYVINSEGVLIDRYDKRFCAGDVYEKTVDLAHYTSGNSFTVFDINNIRCGVLICHDYRYPELYREYKRQGVQVLFHSYHAANFTKELQEEVEKSIGRENFVYNWGNTYPEITMQASMVAVAASSHIWISCPNSASPRSCWGSFFVRADGVITGRIDRGITDILISVVDTEEAIYDSTKAWRQRALSGQLHSGTLVKDKRSEIKIQF